MSDKPETLAAALAAFQRDLPRIGKSNTANTGTYSYKYADLSDVTDAVLPTLGKHGMSFSSKPTLDEQGRFVLAYVLRHESGESDSGAYPLPSTGSPQQIGSAITYARRYALLAVTGVAPGGEDDDGASAPPADRRPVEPHESSWDPAEQEMLRVGWEAEIDRADLDSIGEIAQRLLQQKRSGAMSPATYQHLASYGGRRKSELDRATLPPAGDIPTDRAMRRMYALFREVGISGPDQHEFMTAVVSEGLPEPRVITSSKQLSRTDVDLVILRLEERKREAADAAR